MNRRPTLRDVALEAGVAVSTVSGILNNRSDSWASKETRERVQAAASRLSFVPNRLARGLRLNHHNVAFAVLPDLTNPFFAGLARNLRVAMESNGYELLTEETEFQKERESRILAGLPTRYIDGVVAAIGHPSDHHDILMKLPQTFPIVLLGPAAKPVKLDSVGSDIKTGIAEAMLHLKDLGHRDIGFVDSLAGLADPIQRYPLHRELAGKAGFRISDSSWVHCTNDLHQIRHAVRNWAQHLAATKRPTAVFCTNDLTALAAMRGLEDAGLSIPQDMSVVGFDNIALGEHLHCPLTTISQPIETIAQLASDILLGRITGQRVGAPANILIPTRLLIRSSTVRAPRRSR